MKKNTKSHKQHGIGTVKLLDTRANRATGKYRAQCRYYGPDGAQHKHTIEVEGRTPTERVNQAFEWMLKQKRLAGGGSDEYALTWVEGWEKWKEGVGETRNAQYIRNTGQIAREMNERFPGQQIQHTTLRQFTDFMNWKRDRRREALQEQNERRRARGEPEKEIHPKAGNNTANKARTLLLALTSNLRKEGCLPPDELPFENAPKRDWQQHKGEALSMDELQRYMEALTEPEVALPIRWIVLTGWRNSAACKLRENQIDLDRGFAYQRMKRDKERAEPLDEHLIAIIKQARALKADMDNRNEYLFVNRKGNTWNADTLLRSANRLWERAGLRHKKIHELRTTFATLALQHFQVAQVQAALGHDSIRATEHYNDQKQMDIASIGLKLRPLLNGTATPEASFRPHFDDKKGQLMTEDVKECQIMGETYVRIYCPALGRKSLVSKKKALQLFK